MNRHLNLHLVQWEIVPGDVEENLRRAGKLIEEAEPGKDNLIILPEMFPSGFFYKTLGDAATRSGDVLGWMSDTARQYRASMAGSLPTGHEQNISNTMVFIDTEGKVLVRYHKIHLFPVTEEDRHFIPGDHVDTVAWKNIRIGLAICFDLRFPEMTRHLCAKGVELVIVSSQWPLQRLDHFRDLVRVRAMENQFFVAACNSCGEDHSGLTLGGGSLVADPSGKAVQHLGEDEGVLSLGISLNDVERVREEFPVVKCRRRDIFG